jgi:hypothetical protein
MWQKTPSNTGDDWHLLEIIASCGMYSCQSPVCTFCERVLFLVPRRGIAHLVSSATISLLFPRAEEYT